MCERTFFFFFQCKKVSEFSPFDLQDVEVNYVNATTLRPACVATLEIHISWKSHIKKGYRL